MNDNQDHFNLLRKINSKPKSTQRELAEELGFSLGKLKTYSVGFKEKKYGFDGTRKYSRNWRFNIDRLKIISS